MTAELLQLSFSQKLEYTNFHGHKNALTKVLASTLAVPLLLPIAPRVALMGFAFGQPFLLQALLSYLEQPENKSSANKGYGLIGATILIYGGIPLASAFYWYFHERALFMVRACLATAVYRKTIQAQVSAADDSAALTLMSSDIERIRMGFMQLLHEFWAIPVQVAVACWLLERQLGAAFAVSIIVTVICVVCSAILVRFVGPRQVAWMQRIQKRVGHTANVIGNMKYLKMSGLTEPVQKAIQELREDELKVGGKFRMFIVGSVGIGFTPILLVPVFTFAVTYRDLNVTTIFTSISSYSDPQLTLSHGSNSKKTGSPDDLALQDLALTIEPGQKLAICGRTGSGKSSIILLLLRLLDPLASCASNIFIDNIPLNTIDRSTLRQRIIAVPQDAVFFPDDTSFRINLGPFATATDQECQAVLEMVHLWALVCDRGGLAAGMASDTLSQGQTQLFSLARAILRRRIRERELGEVVGGGGGSGGVLILDEVSSSVDVQSDRAMQEIIRREFQGYTVVMVSHRLDMVMEMFDQVLVMDAGKVVEQGVPGELVER